MKDGHAGECRVCARAIQKEWRDANKDRVAAANKRYKGQNREAQAGHHKNWRDKNAARLREESSRFARLYRDESKKTATNLNSAWTEEDIAEVTRSDISLMQIAKNLGRTYGAVVAQRKRVVERQERLAMIAAIHGRMEP